MRQARDKESELGIDGLHLREPACDTYRVATSSSRDSNSMRARRRPDGVPPASTPSTRHRIDAVMTIREAPRESRGRVLRLGPNGPKVEKETTLMDVRRRARTSRLKTLTISLKPLALMGSQALKTQSRACGETEVARSMPDST